MPKAKGKNPYYFFMLDWKRRAEARGRTFPNGLRDVQADPECSREWEGMTKQQKGPFESLAKQSKFAGQKHDEKRTTVGESVRELELKEKKKQEFLDDMHEYIESVIADGIQHNNLIKKKFYFIHMNWFYIRQIDMNTYDYSPAEFAVAEFSIENGVVNVYHELIKAQIPLGFTREAMETSQNTHQIPIQLPTGESDYAVMYDRLISFLKRNTNGKKLPPLFATANIALALPSLFKRMTTAAHEDDDIFLVYSLEALFHSLRNVAVQELGVTSIPLVVANTEFSKDVFCYKPGLECNFHQNLDGTCRYCSLSVVKRWAFTICDHCCEYLDIEMVPGVHCPLGPNTEVQTLSDSLNHLTLNSTKCSSHGVLSMTGVSNEHRLKVSSRTRAEEELRRNKATPIHIIEHSKNDTASKADTSVPSPKPERPLRPPKTQSFAMAGIKSDCPVLDEMNFPPVGGRGIPIRRKATCDSILAGKGRGC